jgi:hypothetical protein
LWKTPNVFRRTRIDCRNFRSNSIHRCLHNSHFRTIRKGRSDRTTETHRNHANRNVKDIEGMRVENPRESFVC